MLDPVTITMIIRRDAERRYADAERRFERYERTAAARRAETQSRSLASRVRALLDRPVPALANEPAAGPCEPAPCKAC